MIFIRSNLGCRVCFGVRYPSQNECSGDRAIRTVDRIREKLKWQDGFLNGPEWRPKRMHERTYQRLRARYRRLISVINVSIAVRFGAEARILGLFQDDADFD